MEKGIETLDHNSTAKLDVPFIHALDKKKYVLRTSNACDLCALNEKDNLCLSAPGCRGSSTFFEEVTE